jgi:hypothetical protein
VFMIKKLCTEKSPQNVYFIFKCDISSHPLASRLTFIKCMFLNVPLERLQVLR